MPQLCDLSLADIAPAFRPCRAGSYWVATGLDRVPWVWCSHLLYLFGSPRSWAADGPSRRWGPRSAPPRSCTSLAVALPKQAAVVAPMRWGRPRWTGAVRGASRRWADSAWPGLPPRGGCGGGSGRPCSSPRRRLGALEAVVDYHPWALRQLSGGGGGGERPPPRALPAPRLTFNAWGADATPARAAATPHSGAPSRPAPPAGWARRWPTVRGLGSRRKRQAIPRLSQSLKRCDAIWAEGLLDPGGIRSSGRRGLDAFSPCPPSAAQPAWQLSSATPPTWRASPPSPSRRWTAGVPLPCTPAGSCLLPSTSPAWIPVITTIVALETFWGLTDVVKVRIVAVPLMVVLHMADPLTAIPLTAVPLIAVPLMTVPLMAVPPMAVPLMAVPLMMVPHMTVLLITVPLMTVLLMAAPPVVLIATVSAMAGPGVAAPAVVVPAVVVPAAATVPAAMAVRAAAAPAVKVPAVAFPAAAAFPAVLLVAAVTDVSVPAVAVLSMIAVAPCSAIPRPLPASVPGRWAYWICRLPCWRTSSCE